MDKKKIEIIAAIALAVIFALVLASSINKINQKKASARSADAIKQEQLQESQPVTVKPQARKQLRRLGWGRDPFMMEESVGIQVDSIEHLKLMGITAGDRVKSVAIINNQIVHVGSKIGNFKVMKILKDKVIVNDGKNDFELRIK